MPNSLYAQYIKEKTGDQILELPEGFTIYSYLDKTTVYIKDIFVLPTHRKSGLAFEMANMIVNEAIKNGCTKVMGSVLTTIQDSAISMKVLLAYGMRPISTGNDIVYFIKDIK